ncbi:hypothetical protein EIK77_009500 [Talaromyces pinophilus]|nr:hypothetical protein EIK77_009500 [Talaromyces pinophilus]
MTHHHHHHHHGGQQTRISAEARRKLNTPAPEADIQFNYGQQRVDSDFTNAPHTDPKEPSIDQFDVIDIDRGLFRRDVEVTQTVTAVVATAIDVIIESGSQTIAQVTVTSLPAVVSVPALGVITIPADSKTPTAVVAAAATAGPEQQIPLGSSATSALTTVLTTQASSSSQTTQPDSFTSTSSPTNAVSVTSTQSDTSSSSSSSSTTTASPTSSEASTTSSSSISSTTSFSSTTFSAGSSTGSSVTSFSNSGHSTTSGTQFPLSTSTTSAASSSEGGSDTGKIVGGVVGGVLGLLAVLLLAFLLLRWKRKHAQTAAGATEGSSRDIQGGSGPRSAEMMSQRSSNTPLAAAAVLGRWASSSSRRSGRQENPFMAPGERGFQKISGRKIPSVLHTGGDGYGDEIEEEAIPELRTPPLEATSPVSPVSAIGGGSHRHAPMRDDFIAAGVGAGAFVLRPSPARTPTASSVDLTAQSQSGQYGTSPMRPDPLGRTLSRHDGSRSSRFTEGI